MSQKEKIIRLLSDHDWHSVVELHEICWRYGARICDLKKEGYVLDKRKGFKNLEEWRLIPDQLSMV